MVIALIVIIVLILILCIRSYYFKSESKINAQSKIIEQYYKQDGDRYVVCLFYQIAGESKIRSITRYANDLDGAQKELEQMIAIYNQERAKVVEVKPEENVDARVDTFVERQESKNYINMVENVGNESRVGKQSKSNRVWNQIKSFQVHNSFWWFGLILCSFSILISTIGGYFIIKEENIENRDAYSSGVWKGIVLYIIIKAIFKS